MADSIAITKADGENLNRAKLASQEYKNALHLFPPNENNWISKSYVCSAYNGLNIEKTWEIIESFKNHTITNGWFEKRREEQDKFWFFETLKEMVYTNFFNNIDTKKEIQKYTQLISEKKITSIQAAEEIYNTKLKN